MNQFNPMSQDNTPHPHQRFFEAGGNNPDQEGAEQANPEEYPSNPAPSDTNTSDVPPATPAEEAPASAPAPANAPAPAQSAEQAQEYDPYFNETREHLINVRKERNGLILRIDKLQDQRVEKGSEDESTDDSREIMKLQEELWRKNNLIDALIQVLLSLK